MYLAGSGFGTFLSTAFPSIELAMALSPMIFVPLLLVGGGMYINANSLKWYFRIVELISPFKYGYAAACINEFEGLKDKFQCGSLPCDPLKEHDFEFSYWGNMFALLVISIALRFLGYIAFLHLGAPSTIKLT